MKQIVAVGCLCFLLGLPAAGAELAGVTMPDTVSVEGKTLVLNGMGLREKFFIDVYVAGLYLEEKSQDPVQILDSEEIKHLLMHFVYKKVSTKKLTAAWTEGLEANLGDAAGRYDEQLGQLNGWMEDVVRGDEMAFTSIPGEGLHVEIKGVSKGVIPGDDFARAFWMIFIGDKPATGALKRGLLGLK